MLVIKDVDFFTLLKVRGKNIVWLLIFMGSIAVFYHFKIVTIKIPWLPVSVIGTAVAFFVGFKNNQAYDRMWEARKIWGGIINDSRAWGMMIDGYTSNLFTKNQKSEAELFEVKKRLIYRHIGWLYAHRSQLLIPTQWENQKINGKSKDLQRKQFGIGLVDDEITKTELKLFLQESEYDRLVNNVNTATQIINEQGRDLKKLREEGIIDDFRHMELGNILRTFYELQGKNERIKKFPLPRQYSHMSRIFIGIFIFLIPFSMIPELSTLGDWAIWLSIPLCTLIGWVYVMMDVVGENTANPFQGLIYDIPMMSICRTIEIDLLEMLGEKDLPPAIQAKNGVLM
jgi:ion channel-forming bestrophin family protein